MGGEASYKVHIQLKGYGPYLSYFDFLVFFWRQRARLTTQHVDFLKAVMGRGGGVMVCVWVKGWRMAESGEKLWNCPQL